MIRTIHPRDTYACRGRVLIGANQCTMDHTDEVGLIVYEDGERSFVKPVLFGVYPGDEPPDDLERYWARIVHAAWKQFATAMFHNVGGDAYQECLLTGHLDFGPPYGTYKVTAPTMMWNKAPAHGEVA